MKHQVIFGISGSISAYKSLDIIRNLRKLNIQIQPILSTSAHKFVTPWSVESLSESSLLNQSLIDGKISHLDICSHATAFVICPASANIIAKIATGLADDSLTASFLSYTGPKLLFPAMHTEMYTNPITQANIKRCREMGITVIDPTSGDLACGDIGIGRLPDVNLITDLIQFSFLQPLDLAGKKIIITCGGTSQPIDPVRSITNTASGKSGHVMANLAAYFGADVTLIRTKEHPTLDSIQTINVQTSQEMDDALMPFSTTCDCLIMNAAVSDFTVQKNDTKLSRQSFSKLDLTPTNDILKTFNKTKQSHCQSIGFCLSDSEDLIELAKKKRIEKGCEMIVANSVNSFGSTYRNVHIIDESNIQSFKNISMIELGYAILSFNSEVLN